MVKRRKNRLCVAASRPISALFAHKEGGLDGKSSHTNNRYLEASCRRVGGQPRNGEEAVGDHSRRLRGPCGEAPEEGRIRIGGLGILQVRKRAARMGRNPATGEPIKIKASKKVAFRAAKELKEAV